MKSTFILKTQYRDYIRANGLSKENIADLTMAIFDYQADGASPGIDEVGPVVFTLFNMIKTDLDKNTEAYNKKCRVLAENKEKAQSVEGKNKPRHRSAENSKGKTKQQNSAENTIDNDVVIDNDIDNVIDNAAAVADAPAANAAAAAEKSGIKALYEELIGKWNTAVERRLFSHGLPTDVIIYAINEAHDNSVPKLSYIGKILDEKARVASGAPPGGAGGLKETDPMVIAEMKRRIARNS